MKYLKFAESIVSQETIRKFIIKDLVVLLNNKVKTYLTKLGSNFYVEFDAEQIQHVVLGMDQRELSKASFPMHVCHPELFLGDGHSCLLESFPYHLGPMHAIGI